MESTLDRLSEVVGRPIPQGLLAVLDSYPATLAALAERHGLAPYERPLYPDLATVLAANEDVRAEDIWTAEGPWPGELLDIGAEMGGDRFALLLTATPPSVHRLDHGRGRFELIARTLEDFVAALERVARGEARSFATALPSLE